MKTKKPKGPTPSLIGFSNGKPEKITPERKCRCSRCQCDIEAGSSCFGIPKNKPVFKQVKRYCKCCYEKILEKTQKDLDECKLLISECNFN